MDRERVIVYIDENTDDGMMWEELNQNGQMQVSVYDEEYEYDVEYHHSIVVKSLQEHLADYTKQVRKEVCEMLEKRIIKYLDSKNNYRASLDVHSIVQQVMKENLDQMQGENK